MKTRKALLPGAALLAAAASLLQAQTPVRILADNVNLRAKPQLTAEVVAQASYDDRLLARDIGEEWVEVAAPASANLWVMKTYVQLPQNTIGAPRVNLRAGHSINYNIVCTLSLGDPIEPRGEEIQDWIQVAPPPAAHVWVHRDYVEILSGSSLTAPAAGKSAKTAEKSEKIGKSDEFSKKTAKKDEKSSEMEEKPSKKRKSKEITEAHASETAPAPSDASLPTPLVSPSIPVKDSLSREIPVPPPAELKLIPLEGQGRLTEVEGELRAAPLINEAPTRYRVVRWQNNRWQILCHVYGEAAKFRSLQDKRVRLKGREYWIQGAAAPVLLPDQIQEIPRADSDAPPARDETRPGDSVLR